MRAHIELPQTMADIPPDLLAEQEKPPVLVFLDIDGVVNSGRNYSVWNKAWDEGMAEREAAGLTTNRWYDVSEDPYVLHLFDRENIRFLNEITRKTKAKIVISSSWRMFYHDKFQKLRDILSAAGVEAQVLSPTPTHIPHRGLAIEEWLRANFRDRPVSMVILDDESPHSFTEKTSGWLVQTNDKTGLTSRDVDRAVSVIRRKSYLP